MPTDQIVDLDSYDPMAKEIQQDPFPYYAALRARSPVHRVGSSNVYCISRMSTLRDILGRPEIFSSQASNAATRVRDPELLKQLVEVLEKGYPPKDTMLTCDPPAQTRYRKTVGKAFSTRRVLELEPRVRAAADAMIDTWPAKGRVDFMNQFAIGFPVRVIAELLSMDREREADIKRWSDDSVAALGVELPAEQRLAAARGVVELQNYWASRFEACRAEPRDDLVSDLARAQFQEEDGSKRLLTMIEMVSIIQQLMVAGNETTTKLLNATMKLLLENEGEWEAIERDPARIEGVVEESLRLSTPNQGMFRQVREDVVLEGVPVAAGSTLWLIFGSANRDESVFPEPDRFDPTRKNLKEHVAFGRGAHFCIGAPLARLEVRVALEQLSKRLREVRLADDNAFEYEPSYILRGLSALDLEMVRAEV
jgi:cytochrome P450